MVKTEEMTHKALKYRLKDRKYVIIKKFTLDIVIHNVHTGEMFMITY